MEAVYRSVRPLLTTVELVYLQYASNSFSAVFISSMRQEFAYSMRQICVVNGRISLVC